MRQQALNAGLSVEEANALCNAAHFGKRFEEVVEQNLGQIEWVNIKKEAHPSGPLMLAKPDDDVHYNVFGIMEEKLTTITHDKFVIDGINYHLCEKDKRDIVSAPRLVCFVLQYASIWLTCNCAFNILNVIKLISLRLVTQNGLSSMVGICL